MLFAVYRLPFVVGAESGICALRPLRRANSLDKPRQHLFNVRGRAFQHLSLLWSEKSQLLRQQNKTNQFVSRAGSYVQELPEFGASCSSTSLRDIGGDGGRRSSHLAGQAESFGTGISSRCPINTQRQALAPLPYFELPEVLHLLTLSCIMPEEATLAQEYRTSQVSRSRIALTANDKRQTVNSSGASPC